MFRRAAPGLDKPSVAFGTQSPEPIVNSHTYTNFQPQTRWQTSSARGTMDVLRRHSPVIVVYIREDRVCQRPTPVSGGFKKSIG